MSLKRNDENSSIIHPNTVKMNKIYNLFNESKLMSLYPKHDEDFYGWTRHTAQLLKENKMDELDVNHLIEELEDMGRSEKHQLINRFAVLIAHLMKWEYQPAYRGNSWESTIEHQRNKIKRLIRDNPSLKPQMKEAIEEGFLDSKPIIKKDALDILKRLPSCCPYTFEQLIDDVFYPK